MVVRMSGLATGLDTENIIKELMQSERTKLTGVEQKKQVLEWTQESYHEVNKLMANFVIDSKVGFGLAQTTTTGSLINTSLDRLTWVKNAEVADSEVAAATVYADAVNGTYRLNVTQLAENWSAASKNEISSGEKSNLASQFGIAGGDTVNFTITTDSGSVTINKTNLANVAIEDVVSEINAADIGVIASYDEDLDRFFLQTADTGEEGTISIEDNSTLTGGVKFLTGADSLLQLQYYDDVAGSYQDLANGTEYSGKNAVFDFGGAANISQSSNSCTINSINLTLKSTGATNITVGSNTDEIYERIMDFVESYNELIDAFGEELGETRYKDYLPLTDEQREKLTDTQIEQWEEKAKSGLLRNDNILQGAYQKFRSGMYQEVSGVEGAFDYLVEIGITTETYSSSSMGGKLVVNESKLREAIETDTDGVLELLFKSPDSELLYKSESQLSSEEIAQKRSESGLVRRLYDNIVDSMKLVINKAGYGDDAALYRKVSSNILVDFVVENSGISQLERDIDDKDTKLDRLNDYLVTVEDRYWAKYTALEQAISNMNMQSSWLTQMFGQNE